MSESYTDMLRKNYSNMHTDILIEIKVKGEQTATMEILEGYLKNVSSGETLKSEN